MARRQRTHKRQQRGAGAAEHAIAVYGAPGQQHAVAGTNVIAVKPVMLGGSTEGLVEPVVVADSDSSPVQEEVVLDGGKVDLASLAVPAVLIAANHMYGRRRKSSRKTSRKTRRGRRSNRRFSRRR